MANCYMFTARRYTVKKMLIIAALIATTGCMSDADKASVNLSTAADNLEIDRRITFINGFTNDVMLVVEGKCSLRVASNQKLDVVCKEGHGSYKKHFLGLSDNVTYISEQMDGVGVDVFRTRVIIKPENMLPEWEVKLRR